MDNHEGTISLCMIVRDESDNLARCLQSVRGFVEEIIVVDTGSRDATPAIAGHYGATLYHFPWQDDFSQARNESLKHAIGEWVLILDADEELPPETAQNLRHLASCSDVEAWIFTIISPCSSIRAGQQVKHPGLRMFKNREAYFFEGKIHEQIRPSILRANPGAAILHANAAITHYGYRQDANQRREKTLRNISILKQVLLEKPADPFQNYNLGLSYYVLGDLESSHRHYEVARPLIDPSDGFAAAFFRNYSICLGDLGDYEQALNLADEGLACFPDYPDLYFIKGQLYWDLNLIALARTNFLKCLRFRQTLPEYITTEGVTGHLALQNLAEVCAREENFDEAVTYLEQVLRIRPTYELFGQLCSLLQQKGLDGSEITAHLDVFHLDSLTIARLLFDMKEFQVCLSYLCKQRSTSSDLHAGATDGPGARRVPPGRGRGSAPHTSDADSLPGGERPGDVPLCNEHELLFKAKCLLHLGRYAEAVKLILPCYQWSPRTTDLLEQHCLALWLQNPRQDAEALIAAFGYPDDPVVIACREINSLLFNCSADAPDRTAAGCDAQTVAGPGPAVVEQILHLALEALLSGDDDLSLVASLAGCASRDKGDARFALGRHALSAGYSREALQQLEGVLHSGRPTADTYYLLGTSCANLNNHDQAFLYFTQAGTQESGNELYAACALEQLASQCLLYITRMLALEEGRTELRHELFKLTSLRQKMQRLKQNLLTLRGKRQEVPGVRLGGSENSKVLALPKPTRPTSHFSLPTSQLSNPQTDLLSIVMPVFTGSEITQKALQAIATCTDCAYEIIIIDNGSDQVCKTIIAEFESQHGSIVRVICNESNRGYPGACNQGLSIAQGKYVAVMNNDVLVTPHWASRMMAAFSSDHWIGIVGPRTNYVFSEQLVRECHYDESTLSEWSQQWHDTHAGSRQSTLRLVGFLMMIRQELIEQIGGFDPIFGLGNFEDDDYCLRARLAGYQLAIANDVFVHHYGSMSFNKQPEVFSQLLETNKRLFAEKWGLQSDGGQEQTISGLFGKNNLYIHPG